MQFTELEWTLMLALAVVFLAYLQAASAAWRVSYHLSVLMDACKSLVDGEARLEQNADGSLQFVVKKKKKTLNYDDQS